MPPKEKKPKLELGAASQAIKQYLDKTNRPWSVTNIVDSLAPVTVSPQQMRRPLLLLLLLLV